MINKILKNKDFNWNIVDQAVVSGSNFLNIIIIARILGLEQFGELSVLWLFILFINSLHMATIIFPMMSLVPKQQELLAYFSGVYKLQFIFLGLSVLVSFFTVFWYFQIQNQVIDFSLIISFLLVLITYHMQDYYRKYFLVLQKYFDAFIIDFISYILRIIIFLYILFSDLELSLIQVFIIFFITYSLGIIYGAQKYKYERKANSFKETYLQHWELSKWLIPSGVMQWSSVNLYIVTASIILGPVAVGIIRLIQNIIGALNVVLLAIENFLPTKFSALYERESFDSLYTYFKKVSIIGLIGLSVFALFLSLFSSDLLTLLYGKEYSQYGYIMNWYVFIFMFMFLIVPLRGMLRTINETKIWFTAYMITSLFSLLAFYPLEKEFGINGVMFGILSAHVLLIGITWHKLKKIIRIRFESN